MKPYLQLKDREKWRKKNEEIKNFYSFITFDIFRSIAALNQEDKELEMSEQNHENIIVVDTDEQSDRWVIDNRPHPHLNRCILTTLWPKNSFSQRHHIKHFLQFLYDSNQPYKKTVFWSKSSYNYGSSLRMWY